MPHRNEAKGFTLTNKIFAERDKYLDSQTQIQAAEQKVSCNRPWAPREKWHRKEHIIIIIIKSETGKHLFTLTGERSWNWSNKCTHTETRLPWQARDHPEWRQVFVETDKHKDTGSWTLCRWTSIKIQAAEQIVRNRFTLERSSWKAISICTHIWTAIQAAEKISFTLTGKRSSSKISIYTDRWTLIYIHIYIYKQMNNKTEAVWPWQVRDHYERRSALAQT